MKLLATSALLVLSLAACKKDAPPTTTTPDDNTGGDNAGGGDTGGGGEPSAADPSACTADDQCVAVELQCCDACNGGEAVGVHKDFAEVVRADSPRGRGCDAVACTKMACPDWTATCEAGKCTIARGNF